MLPFVWLWFFNLNFVQHFKAFYRPPPPPLMCGDHLLNFNCFKDYFTFILWSRYCAFLTRSGPCLFLKAMTLVFLALAPAPILRLFFLLRWKASLQSRHFCKHATLADLFFLQLCDLGTSVQKLWNGGLGKNGIFPSSICQYNQGQRRSLTSAEC